MTIDYPHKEAMVNGLFRYPEYYLNGNNHEFVVSCYRNMTPTRKQLLFNHEYATLNSNRELNQRAVDACISAVIKSRSKENLVKFVITEMSIQLLRERSMTVVAGVWAYFNNLKDCEFLIMPYLVERRSHYCILFADLRKKECAFYNPLPKYPDDLMTGHEKFRNVLSQKHKTQYQSELSAAKNWKYVRGTGPIQEDNVSCGVYVVRFVESRLKGEPRLNHFDAEDYRNNLKILCLEQSNTMSDVCLYCGKEDIRKCKLWVQCETCKRWIHNETCLKYLGKKTQEEIASSNFTFECEVCLNYKTNVCKTLWFETQL